MIAKKFVGSDVKDNRLKWIKFDSVNRFFYDHLLCVLIEKISNLINSNQKFQISASSMIGQNFQMAKKKHPNCEKKD